MFGSLSKTNSFLAYTTQPSSPISIETSFDVQSFQDHPLQSFYTQTLWDSMGSLSELQFQNPFKNQGEADIQYSYFECYNLTDIISSNSQAPTYSNNNKLGAWPDWELYEETRSSPQVTKSIQKKTKQQKKRSPKLEQPDQETYQNPRRNIPGLLFAAVMKEFREDESFFKENENNLKGFGKDEILSKFASHQMNQKTFNSVAKYAVKNLDQGVMSLVLVIIFLQSERRFLKWVDQSKMDPRQKALFPKEKKEERSLLLRKFQVMTEEVERCLEDCKRKNKDPVQVWDQSYAKILEQKIKNQKKFFEVGSNL